MKLLGLTGDIASGKSSVARILVEMGAAHIDADSLVHDLYADRTFATQVVALFTDRFENNAVRAVETLVKPDGGIDRVALGQIVFGDAAALRRLEALVHPAVAALREVHLRILRERENPPDVAVMEAVKLIESGQWRGCDALWCVVCDREIQIQRMVSYRGLSEAQARARLDAQPPWAAKMSAVGGAEITLLHNNGTPEQLRAQVEVAWKRLLAAGE
jgi:dephospho-CoA kinase